MSWHCIVRFWKLLSSFNFKKASTSLKTFHIYLKANKTNRFYRNYKDNTSTSLIVFWFNWSENKMGWNVFIMSIKPNPIRKIFCFFFEELSYLMIYQVFLFSAFNCTCTRNSFDPKLAPRYAIKTIIGRTEPIRMMIKVKWLIYWKSNNKSPSVQQITQKLEIFTIIISFLTFLVFNSWIFWIYFRNYLVSFTR